MPVDHPPSPPPSPVGHTFVCQEREFEEKRGIKSWETTVRDRVFVDYEMHWEGKYAILFLYRHKEEVRTGEGQWKSIGLGACSNWIFLPFL